MSSIITITFSPCIDKSTSIEALIPNNKLQCASPKLEPGGGGINVARAIKKLGGEALAIYPSGGYTGKHFNHLLSKENIPVMIIETLNESRENIIVLDKSANKQYRFGMPGTALQEEEWKQCLQAIEKTTKVEFIVASGSLPPGVPNDIYGRIALIAKKKNAKLIVDTSGEALKHAVNEGVFLVKPNIAELGYLAGKEINTDEAVNISQSLISKGQCEIVVVSMGADGAMLVSANKVYTVKPPPVVQKSTVGAGDSLVAGIVYSLSNKMNLKEALMYGIACGTSATMNPGTELCNKKDADDLFNLMNQG